MTTYIRDPIHSYIELSDLEVDIIDTSYFQRLQRVNQLGLSKLVYPGANHTRFEHSLGVMYIAGSFAESLNLSKTDIKHYRLAGLLHDIGHGPYSHASESVAKRYGFSHEDISCEIVDSLSQDYDFDSDYIEDIVNGKDNYKIIAGDVDSDRIDYLIRDSYNTGLEHGYIDYNTIIKFADIIEDELVFQSKCLQALESLLSSRLQMTKSVYMHHTSMIAEKMLERAIYNFVNSEEEMRQFMKLNDYQIYNVLNDSDESSRKIYKRIINRNLYKKVFEIKSDRDNLKRLSREVNEIELEKKISDYTNIDQDLIIVHKPFIPSSDNMSIPVLVKDEIKDISEISLVPATVNDSEWNKSSFKIYSPRKYKEDIHNCIENDLEIL
jgi:putative nucleotidyltransferase with HDIG domain